MKTGHAEVRRSHGFHPLVIQRVVQETPDTRSFVLDVPPEVRDLFAYRAGQYCTFRVRVGDEVLLRCYSMSSAPETDAELTVTVKRVPDGRVSGWLNEHLSAGDVLEGTKPAGSFCARDHDRPIVAFAGGSGITPVMSIAKSVLATSERRVRLLYANRDPEAIIFRDALDQLGRRSGDRLEVVHHLDCDRGYLDGAGVRRFLGDQRDADFYLCGPIPFMDLVERVLDDLGIEEDRIFVERFATDDPPADGGAGADDPASSGAGDTAEVPAEVTIVLNGKRHTVGYHRGDTLLDTARRGGLGAPFSCEAGECATCMALVTEGAAGMRVNNALDDDEVEEGWVLTCQAVPQSPTLVVEYEDL